MCDAKCACVRRRSLHDRYLIGRDAVGQKHSAGRKHSFCKGGESHWRDSMKTAHRPSVAALALLAGVSVAAAAGMSKSSTSTPATTGSASSMSQPVAKDSLSLSATQQQTAWKDISAQAAKETVPASFTAKVGVTVPSDLATHPVP